MAKVTENQAQLAAAIARFKSMEASGAALFDYIVESGAEVVGAFQSEQKRWKLWVRPPEQLRSMFGLSLDLLLLVAPYSKVEPRLLSQFALAQRGERFDTDVALLATNDPNIEDLLQRRQGGSAIIPLSLEAIREGSLPKLSLMLQKHLVAVDHFKVTRSLRSEEEFFGRTMDIAKIIRAIATLHQHVGLFGLRKVGKTSLMNRVVAELRAKEWKAASIDMNEVKTGDSSEMLLALARQLLPGSSGLDEALDGCGEAAGILLVVDEVDEILPSRVDGARSRGFLEAFGQLRAICERRTSSENISPVTLAAGVDSSVFMESVFDGRTNPLWNFPQMHFLKPMSLNETSTMIRSLGKRMAMRFADKALQALWDEYGGMPLLTRLACSCIHDARPKGRIPYEVGVEDVRAIFDIRGIAAPHQQAQEIPRQFEEWFPEEGEVFRKAMAGEAVVPHETLHALEYGLIDQDGRVRIGALRHGE